MRKAKVPKVSTNGGHHTYTGHSARKGGGIMPRVGGTTDHHHVTGPHGMKKGGVKRARLGMR